MAFFLIPTAASAAAFVAKQIAIRGGAKVLGRTIFNYVNKNGIDKAIKRYGKTAIDKLKKVTTNQNPKFKRDKILSPTNVGSPVKSVKTKPFKKDKSSDKSSRALTTTKDKSSRALTTTKDKSSRALTTTKDKSSRALTITKDILNKIKKETNTSKTKNTKKTRLQKALDKFANMTQAERNAFVRKRGLKVAGVGSAGVAVSEAFKGIRGSSRDKREKALLAKEKAQREKERAKKKRDRKNQIMNQVNPKAGTSVRGISFTAERDKPVLGSSKNIRMGSGKGTTSLKMGEDDDKRAVRSGASGKKVRTGTGGRVRTGKRKSGSVFQR